MKKTLAIILALSMMLIACKGPFAELDYTKPVATEDNLREINTITLPEAPTEPVDQSTDTETPDDEIPAPPENLDLTIEQCRALALANNLSLKVALINPTITRQQITAAEAQFEALFATDINYITTDSPSADLIEGVETDTRNITPSLVLPLRTGGTINLSMPFTRYSTDALFTDFNPSYTTDLNASITQPLLRDAGIRVNTYAIRVAKYNDQIIQAQTKLEIINTIAQVENLYWINDALRRQLEVKKQEYDLAVKQLERAQRLVKAGEASEVEIIRAEAGVAERVEGIINAQAQLDTSERDLKRLLNIPNVGLDSPTTITTVSTPSTIQYKLNPVTLTDQAINNRMEILELEIQLARNESDIDLARNQLLPRADLRYRFTKNGLGTSFDNSFDMMTSDTFHDHRFGINFQVPIGNEAAKSELKRNRAIRLQRLATKEKREREIELEVYDAIAAINTNWLKLAANRKRTILAERDYLAEIRQNELGLRTSTDVLDAQTRFANAQSAEIRSLADYQIAQVNLATATGNLLGASMIRWEPTELPDEE